MMAVDAEIQPRFRASAPKVLFEGHYEFSHFGIQPGFGYDVSPDGQRFLMVKSVGDVSGATEPHVVQNWFEELRRKAPTGKN